MFKQTRGPWTATPVLIKVEERRQNKQTFLHTKNFKPHEMFWEKAQLVPTVI